MARSKLATQFNHPMLYLFTPRVPFIPISRSLARRTLRLCEGSIELLSALFRGEFSRLRRVVGHLGFLRKQPPVATSPASLMKTALLCPAKAAGDEEERAAPSLLDLPDLALDCVLERLSPAGLRSVSGVCSSLRDHCTSDHLWESHLRRRWGGVIGHAARSEWRCESASKAIEAAEKRKGSLFESFLSSVMPSEKKKKEKESRRLPPDSVMAFYLSLESGEFWFPAQVYNRENGHVGFMLSCYDAHLCYDSKTDTFEARYHPYGRRMTEENIEWDRLRVAPVNTHPFTLHVSDCLHDLSPGDHVEIQWRRNKEFPYGWWYGLVAHLETCDGNESLCRCHYSDTVVLEFKQYCPGSRWRRTMVNRKDHREEGNEVDGFYGGIRKLYDANEVSRWSRFWPTQSLEQ